MSVAVFRVRGRFDKASVEQEGTVSIDRKTGLISVRPLHSRQVWTLPLSDVADMIVRRTIAKEVAEQAPKRRRLVKRGILSLK